MDRILVFSDIHGDMQAIDRIISKIEHEQADHILFAGDLGIDRLAAKVSKLRHLPIASTFVRGNCDSAWSFSEAAFPLPTQYAVLHMGKRIIFLTHGHLIPNWESAPVAFASTDIFVSGHTHRSLLEHPKKQPIHLNPGSASSPRDRKAPTYALITPEGIAIKILATGEILEQMKLK